MRKRTRNEKQLLNDDERVKTSERCLRRLLINFRSKLYFVPSLLLHQLVAWWALLTPSFRPPLLVRPSGRLAG